MSKNMFPLNVSPTKNHKKWYYMMPTFRAVFDLYVTLSPDLDLGVAQNYHISPRHPRIPLFIFQLRP